MANLAEIINHDSRGIFEIILNDVSQDPTVKSLEFAVNKGNIIEVIKVKPLDINGEFPDNQITLKWQYSYGRVFETNAGVVSHGTDNNVTTWFTSDGTETGTPDSSKLYKWVTGDIQK